MPEPHVPFWGRNTVWGKKSILDPTMSDEEFQIFLAERNRDRWRFLLLMFGGAFLIQGVIILILRWGT